MQHNKYLQKTNFQSLCFLSKWRHTNCETFFFFSISLQNVNNIYCCDLRQVYFDALYQHQFQLNTPVISIFIQLLNMITILSNVSNCLFSKPSLFSSHERKFDCMKRITLETQLSAIERSCMSIFRWMALQIDFQN